MGRIRILVVDDSVVVRRVLTHLLSSDPELEVVGSAPNGRIALAKILQLNPDVVTLDIEMPDIDGMQVLSAIRHSHPHLPVIVFSGLSEQSAARSFEILSLGACELLPREGSDDSVMDRTQIIRDQLIPKIKMCCPVAATPLTTQTPALSPNSRISPDRAGANTRLIRADVLAIGVSTGGPNALATLLRTFTPDFPVPVLIVQHMPSEFTKLLAERLNATCVLPVMEGSSNQPVEPGRVWLAPGDYHMTLVKQNGSVRIQINQAPPENSCRPSVDVLFRSAADVYGPHALAVVLTGMGQDGLRGAERVCEAGGAVLAQDQGSSVVWGMPGFVVNAGLADQVLPIDELGDEVRRRVWACRSRRLDSGGHKHGKGNSSWG